MRTTRLLFTAVAVLLPAWNATAIELGPRVAVPVEFVLIFDPRSHLFVPVSSARGFNVASDGTDFFVVWSQSALVGTVGPAGEPPRTTRAGVFGVRIDAAGKVLDAVPIQLPLSEVGACPKFCPSLSLAFAASSDSYLVCDGRAGGCVRVDSRGTLLDVSPIPFLPSGGVLSDGRDHFVLTEGQIFTVNKHARVVAHPIAFQLSGGGVASDGDNFLSFTSLGLTLFDTRGAVLNVTKFPFSARAKAVTFDGDEYLVFWTGPGPEGDGKYVTRVSSDGELLDTSARLPLPESPPFARRDLFFSISFDGMNEVATWCSMCFFERNSAPIAVIQKNDQAEDQIIATQVGTAGPMRNLLALASNSTGVSVVIVDGIRIFPPNINLESFFPFLTFVTTWAPSPERNGRRR